VGGEARGQNSGALHRGSRRLRVAACLYKEAATLQVENLQFF
jgi:hypothetical protein